MSINFLRSIDKARQLTTDNGKLTPPPIAFDILMRILQITDLIKISRQNKFHIRTLFVGYILSTNYETISENDLMKIGASILYYVLMMNGNPFQLDSMLAIVGGDLEAYYISEEHQQNIQALDDWLNGDFTMATPYDFVQTAKESLPIADFQTAAKHVLDLALTLPEVSNMSAEQIFVGSCLFICDKSDYQVIVDLVEDMFNEAIGAGFELKVLLKQTCEEILGQVN